MGNGKIQLFEDKKSALLGRGIGKMMFFGYRCGCCTDG